MPAASTATGRAEEWRAQRNAAALEFAILKAIVTSTALQATRACGGMQCRPSTDPVPAPAAAATTPVNFVILGYLWEPI